MRWAEIRAFKGGMGTIRRMLGALFGRGATKPEDIIFEPIKGPVEGEDESPLHDSAHTLQASKSVGHKVVMADLMARVPAQWKRSADWAPMEVIELPGAARFHAGAERPLAFSLRYLVTWRPDLFRDPGKAHKDVGVDLAIEPLKDTEQSLADIPSEVIQEIEAESATFADWDEGKGTERKAGRKEERETIKALKSVELPVVPTAEILHFNEVLDTEAGSEDIIAVPGMKSGSEPPSGPHRVVREMPANPRLRRILEAYADGLPSPQKSGSNSDESTGLGKGPAEGPSKRRDVVEKPQYAETPSVAVAQREGQFAEVKAVLSNGANEGGLVHQQMRFEELGLSLSRFSEVRGFALWLGEHALQTGELGMDAQNPAVRSRMAKVLESALETQGAPDGFLSVTVHGAKGGVSVFGGGHCLVAVSHHGDGMPLPLRSWLCGWVSQPLRG